MSQEFDNELLDLVKQIGTYVHEDRRNFEKVNETLAIKNEFYGSLRGKVISDTSVNARSERFEINLKCK